MDTAAAGDFTIGEAIRYGWAGFRRHAATLVAALLIVVVANAIVNLITDSVTTAAGRFGASVLSFLVSTILGMGIIRLALAVVDGGPPSVGMLVQTDLLLPYAVTSVLFGIAFALGLVLLVVPGIYVMARWGYATYTVIDEGQTVGGAFRRSSELTEGRRGKLVLFGLALVGLNLLGLLAFVVGLLVTAGISLVAVAYVYRRLAGQPVADQDAVPTA